MACPTILCERRSIKHTHMHTTHMHTPRACGQYLDGGNGTLSSSAVRELEPSIAIFSRNNLVAALVLDDTDLRVCVSSANEALDGAECPCRVDALLALCSVPDKQPPVFVECNDGGRCAVAVLICNDSGDTVLKHRDT